MSESEDDFMVDDESDFDDEPVLVTKSKASSKTIRKAPAKKKANASKTTAVANKKKSITVDSDDEDMAVAAPSVLTERSVNTPSKTKKKKTVEDTYKKMSQLEHILIRPDTYSK